MKLSRLSDLADFLPADSTQAFIVMDAYDYFSSVGTAETDDTATDADATDESSPLLTHLLGTPLSQLDFFAGDIGYALVGDDLVTFIEVSSERAAEDFLGTMLTEDEEFQVLGEDSESSSREQKALCFEHSQPYCFTFLGDLLTLTSSEESMQQLLAVAEGQPSVSSTANYGNVRGRMASITSAFIYVDLQLARKQTIAFMGDFGVLEPGYLDSISQLFPTFGATIKMEPASASEPGDWYAESFFAVDKGVINGDAFFQSTSKYDQNFLQWTSGNQIFEWGGDDLQAQLSRISEILHGLNESAAIIFDSSQNEALQAIFGNDVTADEYASLLDGEYYFGWTPNTLTDGMSDGTFNLILQLDNEEEVAKATKLKDLFASNATYQKIYTVEGGEQRAEILAVQTEVNTFANVQYYKFTSADQTIALVAIFEDKVVMSTSEDEFFDMIGRIRGGQELRLTSEFEVLLPGSDEIALLNLNFLPDGNILKTLLGHFDHAAGTKKIFHDGIFSRYLLTN